MATASTGRIRRRPTPGQTRAAGAVPPSPSPSPAPSALFVLDAHTFEAMRQGEPPAVPYSHDRNVLLLAHVAAKQDMQVFVCGGAEAARGRMARRVRSIYPRWDHAPTQPLDAAAPFALIVCAGLEMLHMKSAFPGAKVAGMVPALHMFEAPGLPPPERVYDFIEALRCQVDFVITQNARMRDGVAWLAHWLARWNPDERLLVAPLGLSADMEGVFDADTAPALQARRAARAQAGLAPADILIVNAGGAWNWTDCDTFLQAACLEAMQGGRIRVYFSGLSQPDNHEVNAVRDRILALMAAHPQCFGARMDQRRPITIEMDWARGGREVAAMLRAGDIGLSVSKEGFENWQSHRVRVIDYLGAGLPLLAAGDDLLAARFCDPGLRAHPGAVDSYRGILRSLDDGRPDLGALRDTALRRARENLDGEAIYGRVLDHIMTTPGRTADEVAAQAPGFIQLIERQSDARFEDDMRLRLRALLHA